MIIIYCQIVIIAVFVFEQNKPNESILDVSKTSFVKMAMH